MLLEALSKNKMLKALNRLDELVPKSFVLIIGGGGAMVMAHGFPLVTHDIDAIPKGMDLSALDPYVKKIAKEQDIAPDWLNPYYSTFVYTLPLDYEKRLIQVFKGTHLTCLALGKEEMLIMKCFAHRPKDIGHAKYLIKKGVDTKFVEQHLEFLKEKQIPETDEALDFFDDIMDQM